MADLVVLLAVGAVALWLYALIRPIQRRRAEARFRAETLRFDRETRLYHWKTLDGQTHQSENHPAKPGGVWYEAEAEGVSSLNS